MSIICSFDNFEFPKQEPFTGCDGKPISDDLLKILLHRAEVEEDYRYCAKIMKEFERRAKARKVIDGNGRVVKYLYQHEDL